MAETIIIIVSGIIGWRMGPMLGWSWWQTLLGVLVLLGVANGIYFGLKKALGGRKLGTALGIIALIVLYVGVVVFAFISAYGK